MDGKWRGRQLPILFSHCPFDIDTDHREALKQWQGLSEFRHHIWTTRVERLWRGDLAMLDASTRDKDIANPFSRRRIPSEPPSTSLAGFTFPAPSKTQNDGGSLRLQQWWATMPERPSPSAQTPPFESARRSSDARAPLRRSSSNLSPADRAVTGTRRTT